MSITATITDFLIRARQKLTDITSEMKDLQDSGDVFYETLKSERIELSQFVDLVSQHNLQWIYAAGWTDEMIITEIHYLSDKYGLDRVTAILYDPLPPNYWVDYYVRYFTELRDTPNGYGGQALKFLRVNKEGTGIEFVPFTTIRRPQPWIGDGITDTFTVPDAHVYEIGAVMLLTVGGIPQRYSDYSVTGVNLSGDSIKLKEPPKQDVEVVLEYFTYVTNINTYNAYWGEIQGILSDQVDLWDALQNSAVTKEDITVAGVGSVGGYDDDDVIPQGTSFTQFVKDLLRKPIPPIYVQPEITFTPEFNGSHTTAITVEYGEDVAASFTSIFTQNDAGNMTEVTYTDSTGVYSCQQHDPSIACTHGFVFQPPTSGTGTIDSETNLFTASIHYLEGPTKDNNFGEPDPTGKIYEGDIEANATITWQFPRFYGLGQPANSTELRVLSKTFSNTFTLLTTTTDLVYSIAIPLHLEIESIIDTDAANFDIKTSYEYKGDIELVPIDNGNTMTYKIYTLSMAVPYSSVHHHNVTLKTI